MKRNMGPSLILMLVGVMELAVAMAIGSPVPVGSLLGSKNANLDGRVALPYSTLLSGDTVQVSNGLAMVSLDQGNRVILGRETEASFLREADGLSVFLTRGAMSLYHGKAGTGLRVRVGDVTVAPAKGCRTRGEIAMVNGLLLVTAKDGSLQVGEPGSTIEVAKGKTIRIVAAAARAPTPVPPGTRHISHKVVFTMAIIAGGAATTLTTIALTRTSSTASPVTPAP